MSESAVIEEISQIFGDEGWENPAKAEHDKITEALAAAEQRWATLSDEYAQAHGEPLIFLPVSDALLINYSSQSEGAEAVFRQRVGEEVSDDVIKLATKQALERRELSEQVSSSLAVAKAYRILENRDLEIVAELNALPPEAMYAAYNTLRDHPDKSERDLLITEMEADALEKKASLDRIHDAQGQLRSAHSQKEYFQKHNPDYKA